MKVRMVEKQATDGATRAPKGPAKEPAKGSAANPAEGQRLSKRVMQHKGCSRSVAEQYIEGGWVSVDGQVEEEPGMRVLDAQRVEVAADANLLDLAPVTLLLHQPANCSDPLDCLHPGTHSASDPQAGRIRVLQRHFRRLQDCAPLPLAAHGLAVFTQDRNIARRLIDDAQTMEHECIVEVSGDVAAADLASLRSGQPLPPAKVSRQSENHLRFALPGTAVRAIPALCASVGLKAVSVRRIRIGRIPLAKLEEGGWRFLGRGERF